MFTNSLLENMSGGKKEKVARDWTKPHNDELHFLFLISNFRRDLNIVYVLLGISPASNCSWPTTF